MKALVIAATMVMGTMSMTAFTDTGAVTSDMTLTIQNLEKNDEVI